MTNEMPEPSRIALIGRRQRAMLHTRRLRLLRCQIPGTTIRLELSGPVQVKYHSDTTVIDVLKSASVWLNECSQYRTEIMLYGMH